MSWNIKVVFIVSLKLCVGFSIFDFVSFLLKTLSPYNVIIPFKAKVIEKPHTVLLPDLWFWSCNKKF